MKNVKIDEKRSKILKKREKTDKNIEKPSIISIKPEKTVKNVEKPIRTRKKYTISHQKYRKTSKKQ